MKHELSGQIFEKYSNIKLHENLFSGGRVVPCGRTDMTKLIDAFRNFSKAPKNGLKSDWLKIKLFSQRTITSKVTISLFFSFACSTLKTLVLSENLFYILKHDSSTNQKCYLHAQSTTWNTTPPAAAR
jgi:hypothetical protein